MSVDPGFPLDLYVTTDLRTMIAVWFGKLAWDAGVRSGKIEVIGPRELRKRLRSNDEQAVARPLIFMVSPVGLEPTTP